MNAVVNGCRSADLPIGRDGSSYSQGPIRRLALPYLAALKDGPTEVLPAIAVVNKFRNVVERVTPCAPRAASGPRKGAHGVTRPTCHDEQPIT